MCLRGSHSKEVVPGHKPGQYGPDHWVGLCGTHVFSGIRESKLLTGKDKDMAQSDAQHPALV